MPYLSTQLVQNMYTTIYETRTAATVPRGYHDGFHKNAVTLGSTSKQNFNVFVTSPNSVAGMHHNTTLKRTHNIGTRAAQRSVFTVLTHGLITRNSEYYCRVPTWFELKNRFRVGTK